MTPLRLLVMDAYAPEGREALRDVGGSEAGPLYERTLKALVPDIEVEIRHPADANPEFPDRDELIGFDGVVWTGSSLTIHDADDSRVSNQIAFARELFRIGVPCFGSCWAAQLAVVASGGSCAASPRGREFGIARRIKLSEPGRSHPLYTDKPLTFDAFTSHQDEIVELTSGAAVLASNTWSRVQAVDVESQRGRFWAVQYHPEYDLHEVASLCRLRSGELIRQGMFADTSAANHYIEGLEALHSDPARAEIASNLGIGQELLDPAIRTREIRNWIASLESKPRASDS
jgi:GMP synthase (glutamine-hydrolysing)